MRPPISLVRPVCGIDNFAELTLGSSFRLDYPDYEIIFCVAQARDPVVPLIRAVDRGASAPARAAAHRRRPRQRKSETQQLRQGLERRRARLDRACRFQCADAAAIISTRLMARWDDATGLVCSPPAGSHPHGFWAVVECAILNTYQARWQYTADTIGVGFAQGKTMLWRRDILERAGGIRRLGQRTRRRRRRDKNHSRAGPARAACRRAVRAAAGPALGDRSLAAAGALGATAPLLVSAGICAGNFQQRRCGRWRRRHLPRTNLALPVAACVVALAARLVRRGNGAGLARRLAAVGRLSRSTR